MQTTKDFLFPRLLCISMLAEKCAKVACTTMSFIYIPFLHLVINLTWPTVMLRGNYYQSNVPTATIFSKLLRDQVYWGNTTKIYKPATSGHLSTMAFFTSPFMFCLLFPLPFFPSALNPAPITNSHGIDLNRSFKICSEAGPSCCYTGSMEKRQTPEHGNNFHKQRQFSQQNGNLIRNLPLCILEMHFSIG